MDLNFDGKHDYKDDAIYNNIINETEKKKSTNNGYKPPSTSHNQSTSSFTITGLGKVAIGITITLCVLALFTGSASIIWSLLKLGFLAFLFAQWLDS